MFVVCSELCCIRFCCISDSYAGAYIYIYILLHTVQLLSLEISLAVALGFWLNILGR
jgi:hypothetical protein